MSNSGVNALSVQGKTRLWQLAGLNAMASLFLLGSYTLNGVDTTTAEGCVRQLLDFHVFWNAGGLALEGRPLDAFDYSVLEARYNVCGDAWMPWLHPAPVMALMTPFALLPFVPAWIAFNLFALALLGVALRAFTNGLSPIWLLILLAPAHLPALLAGQFTVLWMAGLLFALLALRLERWLLAGFIIGCLTIKPPLGVLIPVALIAIGAWRTIFAAAITTLLLHGSTVMLFGGPSYLIQLVVNYEDLTASAVSALGETDTMTSFAAIFTRFGLSADTAIQANLGLALIAAIVLFFAWRKLGPKSDAAAALLTASIPCATPYLWHYDAAFLALTALFLARHLEYAPAPLTAALLAALWFGPGLTIWLYASNLTTALTPILTVPPLLLLAFAASLTHFVRDTKEGH